MSKLCTICGKEILRPQDGVSEYDGSRLQHIKCATHPQDLPLDEEVERVIRKETGVLAYYSENATPKVLALIYNRVEAEAVLRLDAGLTMGNRAMKPIYIEVVPLTTLKELFNVKEGK